jgi:alpha-1,3-mannosyltransferase
MKRSSGVAVGKPQAASTSTIDAAPAVSTASIDPLSADPNKPFAEHSGRLSYPLPLPSFLHSLLFQPSHAHLLSYALLAFEMLLCLVITHRVAYTEIDWIAYMQEVSGFLGGERDYRQLKGDTGPLVYPAGFVYLYSLFYYVTDQGKNIRLAQYLFVGLYVATMYVVHRLYLACRLPPYLLVLLSLSKRLHSIYVLRLFNDCWAMLLLYCAILLFLNRRPFLSSTLLSLALSIKMNILLFLPAHLLLLLQSQPLPVVAGCGVLMLGVQAALGAPFLLHDADAYVSRAFEFSRVFFYKWTVNLKFISETVFLDPRTGQLLLAAHVVLLLYVLNRYAKGGLLGVTQRAFRALPSLFTSPASSTAMYGQPSALYAVSLYFVTNFIGIVFARSLHYQFYSWYAHTLPLLAHLSLAPFPSQLGTGWWEWAVVGVKVGVLACVEVCWNVFPATWWSSALLTLCHAWLLSDILLPGGTGLHIPYGDRGQTAVGAKRKKVA